MRLSKPRYDSVKKVYDSAISEGLRITSEVGADQRSPSFAEADQRSPSFAEADQRSPSFAEADQRSPRFAEAGRPLDANLQSQIPILSEFILKGTVGWFTKPITEAWLAGKVQITLETTPADFEGTVTWAAQRLIISKEVFMVEFGIVESIAAPSITIDFGEEPTPAPAAPAPAPAPAAPVPAPAAQPSPRELQKAKVMKARLRAARALFVAERMTQDYVQEFCLDEDTDWEESDDESDDQ